MSRLQPVNPETAAGQTKELLDAVKQKFGMVPNIVQTVVDFPKVALAAAKTN